MSTRLAPRTPFSNSSSTRRIVKLRASIKPLVTRKRLVGSVNQKPISTFFLREHLFLVRASSDSSDDSQSKAAAAEVVKYLEPVEDQYSRLVPYLSSWESLPARVKLLIATFFSFVICNMDKVNMSVAIIPMAHQFGWNATVSGLVQSAFFYGYMFCQLPGGYLATRFAGSRMLPIGVGVWSGATFGMPVVGGSVVGLCISRCLVGIGEAVAPGSVADVIASIVPLEERSRSVAFVNAGLYAGTVLGLLTSSLLISNFGWESVFYVFGGVGLLWVATWELLVNNIRSSDPETYNKVRRHSTTHEGTDNRAIIPWRAILRCRPVQALMYTHFCSGWFHFSILSWLPSYFSSTMGLSLGDAARISLMPPVAGMVISSIAGPAADALISRGLRVGLVRKLAQTIAFIGPSLCFYGASTAETSEMKIAFITGAMGIGSFCVSGLYTNPQDLSPRYAGFIHSATTTAGAIPGILAVPITGAILDATGSWQLALFVPSILVMISGACIFAIYGRGHELAFDDNRPFAIENIFRKEGNRSESLD